MCLFLSHHFLKIWKSNISFGSIYRQMIPFMRFATVIRIDKYNCVAAQALYGGIMDIQVFFTPQTIINDLSETVAIVIDALRMTSVAAYAVANGCAALKPVAGVEEAVAFARENDALLGGERNALRINGFDFSNSPLEYTREKVNGKLLVMTTTNGTQAILAVSRAKRVLLGAFVNADAVAEAIAEENTGANTGVDKLAIVCAGTYGTFTLEDTLAAGCIVDRLMSYGMHVTLADDALAALLLYQGACGKLHDVLEKTSHYKRLVRLGLAEDVAFCLQEDTLRTVPERGQDGWFA